MGSRFFGTYDLAAAPFDWGKGYKRPGLAMKDLVVYEMPVHGFTAHQSSGLEPDLRGTFAGVAAKARIVHMANINTYLLPLQPARTGFVSCRQHVKYVVQCTAG